MRLPFGLELGLGLPFGLELGLGLPSGLVESKLGSNIRQEAAKDAEGILGLRGAASVSQGSVAPTILIAKVRAFGTHFLRMVYIVPGYSCSGAMLILAFLWIVLQERCLLASSCER